MNYYLVFAFSVILSSYAAWPSHAYLRYKVSVESLVKDQTLIHVEFKSDQKSSEGKSLPEGSIGYKEVSVSNHQHPHQVQRSLSTVIEVKPGESHIYTAHVSWTSETKQSVEHSFTIFDSSWKGHDVILHKFPHAFTRNDFIATSGKASQETSKEEFIYRWGINFNAYYLYNFKTGKFEKLDTWNKFW